MTPDAFLANSKRMLEYAQNAPDFSSSRAIIHAAYYAVYHLSAIRLGLDPTNYRTTSHFRVRQQVRSARGDVTLRKVAEVIEDLYRARARADYDLGKRVRAADAIEAIELATQVFAAAGIVPIAI